MLPAGTPNDHEMTAAAAPFIISALRKTHQMSITLQSLDLRLKPPMDTAPTVRCSRSFESIDFGGPAFQQPPQSIDIYSERLIAAQANQLNLTFDMQQAV